MKDKAHRKDNGYGIRCVISGGQTGVDLAAWDVALAKGVPVGGWVPNGRTNEAGLIPLLYTGIREATSDLPAERTFLNVKLADATLVITTGAARGGTAFTIAMAEALHRRVLHLDLAQLVMPVARSILHAWLLAFKPVILNVAGPRASENGEIYQKTVDLLMPMPLGSASY